MSTLVLSVAVMMSSGGLLAERTPTAGMLIGATDLNVQSAMYDNMTVAELTTERARVAETMPSVAAGVVFMSLGGVMLLTGFVLALTFVEELIVTGLLMMGVSVSLFIIGPILLFRAIRARREVQAQLRVIDQRIASLRRDDVPPLPTGPEYDPKVEPPPPPPVRPPSSEFAPNLLPQVVLAAF